MIEAAAVAIVPIAAAEAEAAAGAVTEITVEVVVAAGGLCVQHACCNMVIVSLYSSSMT